MDLAAKHGLPVPKTYETCESDEAGSQKLTARTSGWIRVDFVDGKPLEDMWAGLEEREKLSICHQLRDLKKSRAIESPTPGIISSCDGTGIRGRRAIADEHGGPTTAGPSQLRLNSTNSSLASQLEHYQLPSITQPEVK
ncbi:hypothetical protein DID88_001132 [Monilinia fructigena]|uniref:Aminoglycoside phosphotransferase domain-containing protein n=1 Tax=Monilinia fructigena TaxID=38457 RepID=A0A395IYT4_9HELO|nr:hypothetical protein DID88_001132 [Monilinia fructigena]